NNFRVTTEVIITCVLTIVVYIEIRIHVVVVVITFRAGEEISLRLLIILPVLELFQGSPGRSIQEVLIDSTSLSSDIIPILNIVCGIVNLQTFNNLPATIEPDRSTVILIFWSCTIYGNILAGDVICRTLVT